MSIKLEKGKVIVDPEFGIGVILLTNKEETVIRFGGPGKPETVFATGADDGDLRGTAWLREYFPFEEKETKTENRKFEINDKVIDSEIGVGFVIRVEGSMYGNKDCVVVNFPGMRSSTIAYYTRGGKYVSMNPECTRNITHAEDQETNPIIFKEGDRVFTSALGWGTVDEIVAGEEYPVVVDFGNETGKVRYTNGGRGRPHLPRTLFFAEPEITEAMLNRPTLPHLEEDTPILVKCAGRCNWVKRHFKRWSDRGRAVTFFDGQSKWTSDSRETEWAEWKLP